MEIITLPSTISTNEYLQQKLETDPSMMEWEGVVVTDYQVRGKGMDTNRWESEERKNLLFSILVHPTWLPASMQYLLSMAEALALRDVLSEYTDGITIKWPNDIYWNDRKISGTRIDGAIKGRNMSSMIIGTGININQQQFHSDAPNPVSLRQITGKEHDREEILRKIIAQFEHYLSMAKAFILNAPNASYSELCNLPSPISSIYHQHLYRRNGYHRYSDSAGEFSAEIVNVQPNGMLLLRRTDGTISRYEFKEVKFLL